MQKRYILKAQNVVFWTIFTKIAFFRTFPIHLYRKGPLKQKGGPLGVSPEHPSSENLDNAIFRRMG